MNISVSLPPDLLARVDERMKSGRYASRDEVICAALRVFEQQEDELLTDLRQAWAEGEASGDGGELDIEAIKAEGRRIMAARGRT